MFIRLSAAAIAALVFHTAPALGASTFFDFTGSGGLGSSHAFFAGGVDVTATGGTFDLTTGDYFAGQMVGRQAQGLGVTNARQPNDSHTVDGYNGTYSDILILDFGKAVTLDTLHLTLTHKGDKLEVFDADLTTSLGFYAVVAGADRWHFIVNLGGLTGTTFGIRAPGRGDSWAVAGAEAQVAAMPTPAAGLGGLVLLGLVIARSRRLTSLV